ncbi:MAG TPA: DUF1559 domain-containing protein [Chthoniobacteraceae bacterium]|nr:DUF1559 domain-containing protein [Chthoniobacteraceae bacterium]
MKPPSPPPLRSGFSLLELMIAIALVLTVLLISLPVYRSYRERSNGYRCMANLRQMGAATMQYAAEHNNELPYYYYITASGSGGSGAITGTWFYNLAPYLGVPRTEGLDPNKASTERTLLGTAAARIGKPCVFTCPSHRPEEGNVSWTPEPMTFPSDRPVSYAPSFTIKQTSRPRILADGTQVFPIRLNEIQHPGSKGWLMDSPVANTLNMSVNRWKPPQEYQDNWPYRAFTRHDGGGNVLFFDGHVRWMALKDFTEPADSTLTKMVSLYFNPWRDPALDR